MALTPGLPKVSVVSNSTKHLYHPSTLPAGLDPEPQACTSPIHQFKKGYCLGFNRARLSLLPAAAHIRIAAGRCTELRHAHQDERCLSGNDASAGALTIDMFASEFIQLQHNSPSSPW